MTPKPHIIVDYDSTLANSQKAICSYYNSLYSLRPNYTPAKWKETSSWNMRDQCPILYEEGKNVLDLFGSDVFFTLVEYFKDAVEVMDYWNSQGYITTICTAGDVRNISHKVVELERDFPYSNIVPVIMKGANGVGKSIVNMASAIFIDDHIENLRNSNASHKILYRDENSNPNNDWCKITTMDLDNGIALAQNWKELKEIVQSIIDKDYFSRLN